MPEVYSFVVGCLLTLLAFLIARGHYKRDRPGQLYSLWDDGHDPHPWAPGCDTEGCTPIHPAELLAVLRWDNGHSDGADPPDSIEDILEKRGPTHPAFASLDDLGDGETVRVSLHTGDPTPDNEVASIGYPRQAVSWTAGSAGAFTATKLLIPGFEPVDLAPEASDRHTFTIRAGALSLASCGKYTAADYLAYWRDRGIDPWKRH